MREVFAPVQHLRELPEAARLAAERCEHIRRCSLASLEPGIGGGRLEIQIPEALFYRVLQEQTGLDIADEGGLMSCLSELAATARAYEKLRGALDEVEATGYGIVMPTIEEMQLAEPEIVRQGGKYGVRLQATAPSIHMMRADITTEVCANNLSTSVFK